MQGIGRRWDRSPFALPGRTVLLEPWYVHHPQRSQTWQERGCTELALQKCDWLRHWPLVIAKFPAILPSSGLRRWGLCLPAPPPHPEASQESQPPAISTARHLPHQRFWGFQALIPRPRNTYFFIVSHHQIHSFSFPGTDTSWPGYSIWSIFSDLWVSLLETM